jgi:hypothetical protein
MWLLLTGSVTKKLFALQVPVPVFSFEGLPVPIPGSLLKAIEVLIMADSSIA